MLNERKLTKPELKKREDIIKGMKSNKKSLVKKYGPEAEKVMYGSATKKAKAIAERKNDKLQQMIEDALKYGISEKKAKKDYDGDGKIESSTEEYKGSRDKAIKKATLKEEPSLKKGDKVTYLGYPGEITAVNKEMTGAITYNVLYDKGTGKTKATNIYNKGGEIKPLKEDWIADSAKIYWLEKFKKGLIDKLPDNPKEAFLAQMTKDQIEHDEETLRRERGLEEDLDLGHTDDEPHMLKGDLYRIGKYAMELYQMVDKFEGKGEVDFPHWWQSKITKSKDMLVSAKHYLDFELKEPEIDAMVGIASREDVIDENPLNELKEKLFSKLKRK